MSCIKHAINKTRQVIPAAVLERAFTPKTPSWFPNAIINIDKEIEAKVIRSIVLPDCNVVGGKEVNVFIGDLPFERVDNDIVVRIPKQRTQNRSIVSITDIVFSTPYSMGQYPSMAMTNGYQAGVSRNDMSASMGAVKNALAALDHIPVVGTSSAELVGDNVILIQNSGFFNSGTCARVVVEYDDHLTNISTRSWNHFAQLVEYAVKTYIYNELIIRMDTGELQGGFSLGIFKEIVSGYADSAQNYKDYLRGTWMKVAMMNDRPRHERMIKTLLGGQAK
jgi:hypothetical protein